MKPIRMNTDSAGPAEAVVCLCVSVFWIVIAVLAMEQGSGVVWFFGAALVLSIALYCSARIFRSFVCLTETSVWHGNEKYTWDEVFLTVGFFPYGRNWAGYLFFDKRYLTERECQSKRIRKKRFFIILTPKRLERILQYYHKAILLENEMPFGQGKRLCERIRQHNRRCYETVEGGSAR